MGILEQIQTWAKQDPNRLAYQCGESNLTYAQLDEQSSRLASWIQTILKDDVSPILVFGHMEPEIIISFLACVKAGRAYIPVDQSMPEHRIERIFVDSQSTLILSPRDLSDGMKQRASHCLVGKDLKSVLIKQEILPLTKSLKDEDSFYIIYTSGSTGNPKGVQITNKCLESFVMWAIQDFNLHLERGIYLNQAPYSFDLSVMDLYPALVAGGTIWAATQQLIASPQVLFKQLANSGLTVWTSTPSFVDFCLSDPSFNETLLPGLRRFLFCGEVLPKQTVKALHERFPKATVFNSYGPTEATVAVTSLEVTPELIKKEGALPVGYCKADSTILILDEKGEVLPDGEKGEIAIIGPSVSKGYLGNEELTKRAFFDDRGQRGYRTGDGGLMVDGLLYYKGRMDFQIKLNGYRIELEDIEHHLRNVSYVQNGVVIPIEKNGRYQSLTAYLVTHSHDFNKRYELTSAIKNELGRTLPKYMIPRTFIYVERLPMTRNGKVDRKVLLEATES